ncbi:MAG: inhibitor of KinA [Paracoccaceae bacterium]
MSYETRPQAVQLGCSRNYGVQNCGQMEPMASQIEHDPARLLPAGDMGILVEFGSIYAPSINNAVLAFDAAFTAQLPKGVIETVPSFRSLLVRFDPLSLVFEDLENRLQTLLAAQDWYSAPPPENRRKWVLPVVYGGTHGPEIAEVADLMQMREDQVADAHATAVLNVAMLGFSPGLAYLGQLPEIWQFPRRTTINPKVPAGGILVAVRQTVLPATDIPTGWWQIGQTPFRSFDLTGKQPFLLSPGDEVRFEVVTQAKYATFDMDDFLRKARS